MSVGLKVHACYNCLDRHLPHYAGRTAIIWEGDEPGQLKAKADEILSDHPSVAHCIIVKNANDPLFILYTASPKAYILIQDICYTPL